MDKLFYCLLCVLVGSLGYSQTAKVQFQLSGGPTLSVPKTTDLVENGGPGAPETKTKINVGGFMLSSLEYAFNEKSSIEGGVGVYLDRYVIEHRVGAAVSDGNRNITQIQIPINYNFHLGQDKLWSLGLGGFINFVLSAREKGETFVDNSQININDPNDPVIVGNELGSFSNNIKDNFNTISFGGFIKLRKDFKLSDSLDSFMFIKINQYINSIKANELSFDIGPSLKVNDEREPTTINLGFGVILN